MTFGAHAPTASMKILRVCDQTKTLTETIQTMLLVWMLWLSVRISSYECQATSKDILFVSISDWSRWNESN